MFIVILVIEGDKPVSCPDLLVLTVISAYPSEARVGANVFPSVLYSPLIKLIFTIIPKFIKLRPQVCQLVLHSTQGQSLGLHNFWGALK